MNMGIWSPNPLILLVYHIPVRREYGRFMVNMVATYTKYQHDCALPVSAIAHHILNMVNMVNPTVYWLGG